MLFRSIKKWDTTNSCKIYLIVTHGIFSQGFLKLGEYFDGIFCTNSYKDINTESLSAVASYENKTFKQLNIF